MAGCRTAKRTAAPAGPAVADHGGRTGPALLHERGHQVGVAGQAPGFARRSPVADPVGGENPELRRPDGGASGSQDAPVPGCPCRSTTGCPEPRSVEASIATRPPPFVEPPVP